MMEEIDIKKELPENYHCSCEYCVKYYAGEVRKKDGSYFSGRKRVGYSDYEKEHKHIAKGHPIGYQFMIEQYTHPGDLVFDPFAGSGTALVEAAKLKRNATGIELEFADITRANIAPYNTATVYEGDSKKIFESLILRPNLIVTGPPYNNHADAPERKKLGGEDKTFDYENKDSSGVMTDAEYDVYMEEYFKKMADSLVEGGHMVTIIKDPIRKKEPYLLHKKFCEIMERAGLVPEAMWLHYHYPPTLFMSTYSKRFPEVRLPLYQTMNVFRKGKSA